MTSPFVEILVTKLDAQLLFEVLPVGEERRRLSEKIRACEIALTFLQSTEDEAEKISPELEPHSKRREVISLPLYPH
jgi:hypothetical protein